MSSKIFKAIWTVTLTVFLASLVFIMGAMYQYYSNYEKKQLRIETELAAQGVALSGSDYFEGLDSDDYRITWVSPDGSVLYDNEAKASEMQNHMEREEIKEAMEEGFGEATRKSYTLTDQEFYAAKRLPDGSVLRMSIVQLSIGALLLGFGQPICFIILLALVLSLVLASRLANAIVKPINEIDLLHPEKYNDKEDFREVEPLLRHITTQNNQIKDDQKAIEEAALVRQEFSANVSHELKTPLHAISGYAELLENEMVKSEDIKTFAGKISAEASRLTRLVEDIIDLTKLDNGGSGMEREDCDLFVIAQNAVGSLENTASQADITMTIEGVSAPMKGVPHVLYSIVYNLCDNAIKYNRRGGEVRVSVDRQDDATVLTVSDTGVGIPEESLDRIYERFYRVDKSRSKSVGGTGLGLSIVKHAVNIHNGEITVNSKIDEGTEITVTLPDRS